MPVPEEYLAQDQLDVIVPPAQRDRVLHQLAEAALVRHGGKSRINQRVQVAGMLVHGKRLRLQRGKEALGVHGLAPVVKHAVPLGEVGGAFRIQRRQASPNLGADGTAHALGVVVVAEGARRGGMDAPEPVLAHDGVLAGGVVAVRDKALQQLVGGEVRSVLLRHVQPQHLQVEVIVGQHGVDHFGAEGQLQRHLDALVGGAQRADHGLAQKAAVYLVEILLIGKSFHRCFLSQSGGVCRPVDYSLCPGQPGRVGMPYGQGKCRRAVTT